MGEIKSTLDLVMEKTRHLKLSQEEKEEQKQDEIQKRIKGLLLKYQGKLINKQQLKNDMEDLRSSHRKTADQVLRSEILDGIDLDKDNTSRLELLKEICGLEISGLEVVLHDYLGLILESANKRIKQIKKFLSKKRFVSGSAVIPNLERDTEWLADVRAIKNKFAEKFNHEKKQLSGSQTYQSGGAGLSAPPSFYR